MSRIARRITDPRQQGWRLSWFDSLFERVAPPMPPVIANPPIPVGEVADSDWAEFNAAVLQQELREQPASPQEGA